MRALGVLYDTKFDTSRIRSTALTLRRTRCESSEFFCFWIRRATRDCSRRLPPLTLPDSFNAMGTSLFYVARRPSPLSNAEQRAIIMLIREFSVEDQIKEYLATGVGFSGESFNWSFKGSDQAIFTGSVGLPNIGVQDMVDGANHWGQLLGRVRSEVLPDAEWEVRIENEPMLWNLFDLVFHIEWDEAPADQTVALARIDETCLLYTSPSPRDATLSRMPSSA